MDKLEDHMNQVYRMALAAMQGYTYWIYTEPDDSPYEDTIKKFGHFFYATNEAHFTALIIALDALYDEKPSLVNFTSLLALLPAEIPADKRVDLEKRLTILKKRAEGVGIVRNNSFAHVVEKLKREAIAKKHGPSNPDLFALCAGTFALATDIGNLLGQGYPPIEEFSATDVEQIQGIFATLATPAA